MRRLLTSFLFLALITTSLAIPVRDKYVEVELFSEVTSIQPGTPFWVALKLKSDPEWHTYWKNWGDSGLATKIKWTLPEGFEAGPIEWPAPERIETPPLVSFGYVGTTYLLEKITPPATLAPGTNVSLVANASWLMCKELCIPGKAIAAVRLPVKAEPPQLDDSQTSRFATARAALPQPAPMWNTFFTASGTNVQLVVAPPDSVTATIETLNFYPDERDVIEYGPPQQLARDGNRYVLNLVKATTATGEIDTLRGVLRVEAQNLHAAYAVEAPRQMEAPKAAATTTATSPASTRGLGINLLFAFIGGMILNLMPCVFPVISLKILSFVHQAHESRGKIVAHGLVYAAGVLLSFWVLAALLLVIRQGGEKIGWGFQMQSPGFVIALIALFFTLGLNLVGVFEMGLSLTGAGGSLTAKSGWSGSFFSGLLATIVATPCTGPLMSVALGYTLSQPPFVSVLVFSCLGLGMAAPYVALTAFPALTRKLPKPGAWMETMKQFMGLLLLATVVWLLAVLGALRGLDAVIRMLTALIPVAIGLWILGRWGALSRAAGTRVAAHVIGLGLAAAGLAYAYREAKPDLAWEPYTQARVDELLAKGEPVFVDFTATWCLTCQANKFILHRKQVERTFNDLGVHRLLADWTDGNETITRALEAFGRNGVPLYVLYSGQPNAPPAVLPEILTPEIVIESLEKHVRGKQ